MFIHHLTKLNGTETSVSQFFCYAKLISLNNKMFSLVVHEGMKVLSTNSQENTLYDTFIYSPYESQKKNHCQNTVNISIYMHLSRDKFWSRYRHVTSFLKAWGGVGMGWGWGVGGWLDLFTDRQNPRPLRGVQLKEIQIYRKQYFTN